MIGNDLVDLATARKESNWRRSGFLEKIFTEIEQSYIRNALNPDNMVWILWSMKESAYKIWHRENGLRKFNPKSFICWITSITENEVDGKVFMENKMYHSKSKIDPEFIHTVCQSSQYSGKSLYITFTNQPEELDKVNSISRNTFGIPYFTNKKRAHDFISISHHGVYCSYLSTFKLG